MKTYNMNDIGIGFMKNKIKHTEKFVKLKDLNKILDDIKQMDIDNIEMILSKFE